jgi:hypothetical protein
MRRDHAPARATLERSTVDPSPGRGSGGEGPTVWSLPVGFGLDQGVPLVPGVPLVLFEFVPNADPVPAVPLVPPVPEGPALPPLPPVAREDVP